MKLRKRIFPGKNEMKSESPEARARFILEYDPLDPKYFDDRRTQPHPLRGYTNFGIYEVRGMNPETGRMNTKRYEALTIADAVRIAHDRFGLVEPITAQELGEPLDPKERNETLEKMGIEYLCYEGLACLDFSALICKAHDGDPEDSCLTFDQWARACRERVEVSRLCGPTMYRSIMKNGKRK